MIVADKISFTFRACNTDFANELYSKWDVFCRDCFAEVVDDVLATLHTTDDLLIIDSLDLRLGTIPESEFYVQFPIRLRRELEQQLPNISTSSTPSTSSISDISERRTAETKADSFEIFIKYKVENLLFFLEHGQQMPLLVGQHFEMNDQIRFVIKYAPEKLIEALIKDIPHNIVRQRVIQQADAKLLEEIDNIFAHTKQYMREIFGNSFANIFDGPSMRQPDEPSMLQAHKNLPPRILSLLLSYPQKRKLLLAQMSDSQYMSLLNLLVGGEITSSYVITVLQSLAQVSHRLTATTLPDIAICLLVQNAQKKQAPSRHQWLANMVLETARLNAVTTKDIIDQVDHRTPEFKTLDCQDLILAKIVQKRSYHALRGLLIDGTLAEAGFVDIDKLYDYYRGLDNISLNNLFGDMENAQWPDNIRLAGSPSLSRLYAAVLLGLINRDKVQFAGLAAFTLSLEMVIDRRIMLDPNALRTATETLSHKRLSVFYTLAQNLKPIPPTPFATAPQPSVHTVHDTPLTKLRTALLSNAERSRQLWQQCDASRQQTLLNNLRLHEDSTLQLLWIRVIGTTALNQATYEYIELQSHIPPMERYDCQVYDFLVKMTLYPHANQSDSELTTRLATHLTNVLPHDIQLLILQTANFKKFTSPLVTALRAEMGNDILSVEQLPIEVNNAGLVLLWPWLPLLFKRLDLLTDDGTSFKDEQSTIRAIFALQYALHGDLQRTYRPEELFLNRLLTACHTDIPLPPNLKLTQHHTTTVDQMVETTKQHWHKMEGTSMDSFRQSFLVRQGILQHTSIAWQLKVVPRSYDILLDSLPWNFRDIHFPWLKKNITVNWR